MIAMIDYGVGNLFSLDNALKALNIDHILTKDKTELEAADGLILPGVGAFEDAMIALRNADLVEFIQDQARRGKKIMGICLGMQLLYQKSSEFGSHPGLGLLDGEIVAMTDHFKQDLKIPHMGYNDLNFIRQDPLLAGIKEHSAVYFIHSYYVQSSFSEVIATADYEVAIPAIVHQGNLYGMQFHPEKSGKVGLKLLDNFCQEVQRDTLSRD